MAASLITPEQIRSKALRLYPQAVLAWLEGSQAFFPAKLKLSLKIPPAASQTDVIRWAEELKLASKETLGQGYSLARAQINSRRFGDNIYPTGVVFDTFDDLLKYTRKTSEFQRVQADVGLIRASAPQLETWLKSSWKRILDLHDALPDLLSVVDYLRGNPRPDCYIRELPIPVSTKLVAKHKALLRTWLDITLDPQHIYSGGGKNDFESRYGFRSPQTHVLVRLLDASLMAELGLPCQELSMPAEALGQLAARDLVVFAVENKVSLINALCLPPIKRGIAIGALGNNLAEFTKISWLANQRIIYWGDIDVEGLEILSRFRFFFPQVESMLMDAPTLHAFRSLCGRGNGKPPSTPQKHLTASEAAAAECCQLENLRLEQEHIPFPTVLSAVQHLLATPNSI